MGYGASINGCLADPTSHALALKKNINTSLSSIKIALKSKMNAWHRFLHGRFGSRVLRVSYVISNPHKLENAPSIPPYPPKLARYHQPSPIQAAILEQDPNALVAESKLPSRLRGEQSGNPRAARAGEHPLVEETGCTEGLPPIRSPSAQTISTLSYPDPNIHSNPEPKIHAGFHSKTQIPPSPLLLLQVLPPLSFPPPSIPTTSGEIAKRFWWEHLRNKWLLIDKGRG